MIIIRALICALVFVAAIGQSLFFNHETEQRTLEPTESSASALRVATLVIRYAQKNGLHVTCVAVDGFGTIIADSSDGKANPALVSKATGQAREALRRSKDSKVSGHTPDSASGVVVEGGKIIGVAIVGGKPGENHRALDAAKHAAVSPEKADEQPTF